jgi:hypothetical protein
LLVVATKEDVLVVLGGEVEEVLDDVAAVGATVNVVAKEDEAVGLVVGVVAATVEEGNELVVMAVDVADGDCEHCGLNEGPAATFTRLQQGAG